MLETIATEGIAETLEAVRADVVQVCKRIPPLWGLSGYVAVNPFLGFASRPIDEAAVVVADGLGAEVLPEIAYYRARWEEGAFGLAELNRAADRAGLDPEVLASVLAGRSPVPRRNSTEVPTFAERLDRRCEGDWNDQMIRSTARWCAVHVAGGGTYWGLPAEGGFYGSWREAARVDRSLEIAGLHGWRDWVEQLPDRPDVAIAAMLDRLDVPAEDRAAYLYRLLGGLYGWASYLRRSTWAVEGDAPGPLADLLAVRICGDAAVVALAPRRVASASERSSLAVEEESVRLVFQEALEDAFTRDLLGKIIPARPVLSPERPAVQGVFCIDVRSEPLRRHLESQSASIETRGFAGFFGVAFEWAGAGGGARCPVLLSPNVSVRPSAVATPDLPSGLVKSLQGAPAAAFSFVETLGLVYGLGLARDACDATPAAGSSELDDSFTLEPDDRGHGISLATRIDLAAGILKNMSLSTSFARLVLLCGHAGRSANNPHAAGLDCGACGGRGGAINARVAAAILNDPKVREGLRGVGWDIPADTHFLPGVHDTSIDEVTLLDVESAPESHREDVERLRGWLAQAGSLVRAERAPMLGLGDRPIGTLARLLGRRARDWSEVRPEWGLARNAAFIAARRARTRGVDLQGRAFLNEYDWTTDPDASILTLILSAPMVVASWINLQYFASTVDNRTFGCGTKALHNRVGSIGVVLGNGGDLRTGLAIQSVHAPDGSWHHEPLRLQVVVEAPRERIEAVLDAQPGVADLIQNGWVRLVALDPEGEGSATWVPHRGWEPTQAG